MELQTEPVCTEPRVVRHHGAALARGLCSVCTGFSLLCLGSVLSLSTEICEETSSHSAYCSPDISRDACTLQYLQGTITSGMLCVIYSAACHAINRVCLLLKWHELRKWAGGLRDWGCWSQAAVVAAEAGPCFSGSKLD